MPNLPITGLPSATTPPLSAELAVAFSGVTYKATLQDLANAMNGTSTPTLMPLNIDNTLSGNGSVANPLGVTLPLPPSPLAGTFLGVDASGNLAWLPVTTGTGGSTGDNWGSQTVVTDASLTGDGTTSNPLKVVGSGGGTPYTAGLGIGIGITNEIYHSSGTNGHDGDVSQAPNSMALRVTGLSGRPLSNANPTVGDVISWNGLSWVYQPVASSGGDDWGNQVAITDATLTGDGTSANPLSVTQNYIPLSGTLAGSPVTGDIEVLDEHTIHFDETSGGFAHLKFNDSNLGNYVELRSQSAGGTYAYLGLANGNAWLSCNTVRINLDNTIAAITNYAQRVVYRGLGATAPIAMQFGLNTASSVGFFGATPITPPAAPTGSNAAKINGLIAIMQNYGLLT